jgi:DNA (cytosine-5)-methyltransferase 1
MVIPVMVPDMVTASESPKSLPLVGLFAGIGGLELGLSRSGHESLLVCELDRAARAVLDARLPGVGKHDDVRTLRALPKETRLVAAGFPCQDLSQAGQTRGIEGDRSGLVGEVFRLLRKSQVPWVVLENVPFMLQLARGQALAVIVRALEELRYRWAYRVVDARAFGLPQRRRRVFLVASLEEDPRRVLFADDCGTPPSPLRAKNTACGFYWTEGVRGLGWAVDAVPTLKGGSTVGVPSAPAIWLPDGSFVTPDIRDAERMQGFRAGWTLPAERVVKAGMRWKLVGNAVSVPVAAWLGRRLRNPGAFELQGARPLAAGAAWPSAAWNVGDGVYTANISEWPRRARRAELADFLHWPGKPLSSRATAGFLSRTTRASLRFPPGLIDSLQIHLARVLSAERDGTVAQLS